MCGFPSSVSGSACASRHRPVYHNTVIFVLDCFKCCIFRTCNAYPMLRGTFSRYPQSMGLRARDDSIGRFACRVSTGSMVPLGWICVRSASWSGGCRSSREGTPPSSHARDHAYPSGLPAAGGPAALVLVRQGRTRRPEKPVSAEYGDRSARSCGIVCGLHDPCGDGHSRAGRVPCSCWVRGWSDRANTRSPCCPV